MRLSLLLVAFLVLVTVFSVYTVVYTQGLPTESKSTVTVGTFSLLGTYNYVATLSPNPLYNATTLMPGQGPLFVAITKSINVTYTCTVSLSQQGNISLDDSLLVALSGGVWNKTLDQGSQSTLQAGTYSATLSKSFLLNVSQTVTMAKDIGTELQYSSSSYLVQFRPVATGSFVEAGRTVPLDFVAPLNLTISQGVITPSNMTRFQQGNITSEVYVTYSGTDNYRYASYGFVALSLFLLVLGLSYVLRIEERKEAAKTDDMTRMTQPYVEVIAATTSLPKSETQVAMEKWEDLVKVADTLGKPILEFVDKGEGYIHYMFWVLDGQTSYTYEANSKPKWAA